MSTKLTALLKLSIDDGNPETVANVDAIGLSKFHDVTSFVQNTTTELWASATPQGSPADWNVLVLTSDVDVDVEFAADLGNAGEALWVQRVKAGWPFVLGSQIALYAMAPSDGYLGAEGLLGRIRCRENLGGAANVRLQLFA